MRREDWIERLGAVFRAASERAFERGVFDCCTFGADCVQAVAGIDPAADLRGTYHTVGQAYRVLRRRFGGMAGMLGQMAAAYGWAEKAPAFAQRGDLVLIIADDGQPTVAVVGMDGRKVFYPATAGGLTSQPLHFALRAWGVK